jgi:alpha-1,3-rhamnosyl/mannosyltransferase
LNETYPYFSKYFINRVVCEITRHFVFRNTKFFISISNVVKEELRKHLKSGVQKPIKTVYLGIDKSYFRSSKIISSKKFYLAMGDFAPRKNIQLTIRAYSMLPREIRNIYPLKIITSTLFTARKFKIIAKKVGVSSRVKVLVNITEEKLKACYSAALAFVYPSLYEGFGLPIIEAMACGCPVITSNYGAMKEVAGNGAIFINPRSAYSIKKAMLEIIKKDNESKCKLINRGIERAKQFSWEKTATDTLKIYENI